MLGVLQGPLRFPRPYLLSARIFEGHGAAFHLIRGRCAKPLHAGVQDSANSVTANPVSAGSSYLPSTRGCGGREADARDGRETPGQREPSGGTPLFVRGGSRGRGAASSDSWP